MTRDASSGSPAAKRQRGITLLEAMLCIVLLGLTASGISSLYVSGLQSLEQEEDRYLLDNRLRNRIEQLIGRPFADVRAAGSGSENVTIGGEVYVLSWTVVAADLDGDAVPEPDAMQVTVSLAGRSLTVILVDHQGKVARIP